MSTQIKLSLQAFAREMGVSRETLRKRIAASDIRPAGEHRSNEVYRLRDLMTAFMAGLNGAVDPEKLPPFQKKAYFQAKMAEVDYLARCGDLCARDDVAREMAHVMKAVAWFCDVVPDVIERDAGATPRQIHALQRTMDKLRTQLYEKTVNEASPADDKQS